MNDALGFVREAFDAAPVGMLVVDAAGVVVDVNKQLEALFGYPRAELVGQPVELLVDGLPEVHATHRERYFAEPRTRPMGAGRDLYGRHREGHRIPVEIGLTPLPRPAGTYVVASVVDLTERRRAEEQFRLAIEAAPNGMMLVDERGTIVLINAQIEQVFGYARAELVGQSVDRLLPAKARGGHAVFRDAFFTNPQSRPMGAGRELFGLHRDGREVPVEIGLSPLRTAAGLLVLCSIVDITERRHAREQLQASLAEKEMLLKELHHRAKNNLQLIGSLLDLASSRPGPEALAECRERIHSIALVHEKLYQAGTFARIDFREYLQTLGEQVAHAWRGERQVRLSLELAELSLPLDAAIPCGLIVNELLTNAYKHAFAARDGGHIVLRARRDDGLVRLELEDDGVGFEPHRARREGHIGLDLVHALARQLRAQLHFDVAAGTRATLTFPGGQA
ncbi:MAG: sensor histidine kinase [Myxococcota bacterium]